MWRLIVAAVLFIITFTAVSTLPKQLLHKMALVAILVSGAFMVIRVWNGWRKV